MASPEHGHAQLIPASVNNSNSNDNSQSHDRDLLQSLNKLTLSTSPHSKFNAPSKPAGDRRPSSVSSNTRAPIRSPLTKANVNGIAADTQYSSPSLIRKASMNSLYSANGGTPSRTTSRRGSSTSFLSPTTAKSPTNLLPSHPPRTAASVASIYFAKELEHSHSMVSNPSTETIVILHDDCYGHRYSRPRASKSLLNTIVERPERIQASILGVSMAYVRLGERHCEGKHPIQPIQNPDPETFPSIPFRIHKTTRKVAISSAAVTNVHGNKWMEELKIMCDSAEAKLALNGNELRRPEINRGSDAEPPQHLHQGDLYLCPESLNAFEGALGAVCEAVDTVFSTSPQKRAFIAVRPPGHHCSASFPSGFCWVNNVHVGIMHGILNHGVTHAAIIDFDLHHGDGSQAIAWQHNKRGLPKNAAAWKKTSIGYFSVHDINSYPCEYGDEEKVKNASLCIENAHGQNIWNVHLHEWKSDVEFWKLYQSKYSILLEKTRNYLRLQTERFRAAGQVPKAAIFLSAGFDASEWEGAGMQRHKVNVPTEFYARLTRDVVRLASEEGLGVDGRVISVLEGGYSDRALYSGVLSHLSGLVGAELTAPREEGSYGLVHEMGDRIEPFRRRSTLNEGDLKSLKFPYDPNWWSIAELDRFDADRIAPPPEPKKPRTITPGNYSSPTQSSNAKMTEVAKIRRSLSTLPASQTIIPRSPTPPPPDVPWTTAANELSKLLIPNNRQVDSCTHAELNTEATKAKKDRQSLQTATTSEDSAPVAPTRMSLRERKPVSYLEDDDYQSRRKTVAGPTVLVSSKASARGAPTPTETKHSRQASRRLSTASSLSTVADIQAPADVTTRPGSSLSVRPSSSMSVRTQASTAMNSRRGRPAVPPRKDSGRAPRAPRKTKPATAKAQSPPSTAVSEALPNANDGHDPLPLKSQTTVATAENTSMSAATPAALDQITAGMKKIKINVLTKEQKAARLKAKAEMCTADTPTTKEETPSNKQPFSPPTPAETLFIPTASDAGIIQDPIPPVEAKADSQHDGATPTESKVDTLVPTTPTIISPTEPSLSSTPFTSSPPIQPPSEPTQDSDLFVPYQPDGPPPTALPIQRPVQILEPNTGTPARPTSIQQQHPRLHSYSVPVSPVRRGGHGFTATSNIPFSPGPVLNTRSISKDDAPILPRPTTRAENIDSDTWGGP